MPKRTRYMKTKKMNLGGTLPTINPKTGLPYTTAEMQALGLQPAAGAGLGVGLNGVSAAAQTAASGGDTEDSVLAGLNGIGGAAMAVNPAVGGAIMLGTSIYSGIKERQEKKKAEAEARKVLEGQQRDQRIQATSGVNLQGSFKYGGSLKELSSDTFEVSGATHEEGGVKLPSLGVEVEDGETIGGNFVFSEELGFADRHKPIAMTLGKLEKKAPTKTVKNTINLLRRKEGALKQEQEQLKEVLGIGTSLSEMETGGEIKEKRGDALRPEDYEAHDAKRLELLQKQNTRLIDTRFGVANPTTKVDNSIPIPVIGSKIEKTREELLDGYYSQLQLESLPDPRFRNSPELGSDFESRARNKFTKGSIKEIDTLALGGRIDGLDYLQTDDFMKRYGEIKPVEEQTVGLPTSKKLLGDVSRVGDKVLPFADNIVNMFRDLPEPTAPLTERTLSLDKVNYGAQRAEADRQRVGFNRGIDASTSNTGVALSNKAAGLTQTIRAKNAINEAEANQNAEIGNKEKLINSTINARNVGRLNEFNNLKTARSIKEQSLDAANLSNAVTKLQQMKRDQNLTDLESRKIDVVLKKYQETGVLDRNLLDEILKEKTVLNKKYGGKISKSLGTSLKD